VSDYLGRLATRNLNNPGAMTPATRSMSPIAEEDQRVGTPGFEDFQFGAAAGRSEDTSETAGNISGIAQRKSVAPVSAKSEASNPAAAGRPVTGDEGTTWLTPSDVRPSRQRRFYEPPQANVQQFDEREAGPWTQAAGIHRTANERIAAREIMPNAGPPAYLSESPRSGPAASFSADGEDEGADESGEIEVIGSRLRRPSVAGPQTLEPPRRAVTPQRESISADDAASSGETGQGPRVVIGNINVEVTPPPVEPKTSAPSRPGPLTAESISVIGPLSRGLHSNLRLSLRHR
jgi:hypothetical protein